MGKGWLYSVRRKLQIVFYDLATPELVSKVYFRIMMGEKLDLENPKTYNEKIQWLKLYEWPNNELAVRCGDKFTVREYLEEKGLAKYLPKLIGVWESAEDISWEKLPDQFAIKVSNGCGYNIVCDNKETLDIKQAKRRLSRWMKEDFGKYNAEPHYSRMKSHIICEEYLGGEMIDYKFYCFNGEVGYMNVTAHPNGMLKSAIYLSDGEVAPFKRTGDSVQLEDSSIPVHFDEMKKISEYLAKEFPFVRIDFFEVEGKIFIGEMTFTPNGGLGKIEPIEYDYYWGSKIDISQLIEKHRRNKF